MLSLTATGMPYRTPDGWAACACVTSALRSSRTGVRQALNRLALTRRSAVALALASASLGSVTNRHLESAELRHQEEAVLEGGRQGLRTEGEGDGLHFVDPEAQGVRAGHERLHAFARGHGVDLCDVVENARHLLGQEGQRFLTHVQLREARDLQHFVVCDAHALSHSRSSPA